MKTSVSIVIPVFNEAESIGSVVASLRSALDTSGVEYEILCVNDCSTDKTAERLAGVEGARVITHARNRGYGASIKTGMKHAVHEIIATLDADGQHRPEDLVRAIRTFVERGDDLVIGARAGWEDIGKRFLGKRILRLIGRGLFQGGEVDFNSGLRVFTRNVALKYQGLCSNRFSFSTSSTYAFIANGHQVSSIEITVLRRTTGESRVRISDGFRTLWRMLGIAMAFRPCRVLMPLVVLQFLAFAGMLAHDLWFNNIGDGTVILFTTLLNLLILMLLAEQIAGLRRS